MEGMRGEGKFCWLDGSFHRETETPVNSRLFRNGIVIGEVIRTLGTRLAFFHQHYKHLASRLDILAINLPDIITADEMHRHAVDLINKNRYFGGNGLRISILYDPGNKSGSSHCLMECVPLEQPSLSIRGEDMPPQAGPLIGGDLVYFRDKGLPSAKEDTDVQKAGTVWRGT